MRAATVRARDRSTLSGRYRERTAPHRAAKQGRAGFFRQPVEQVAVRAGDYSLLAACFFSEGLERGGGHRFIVLHSEGCLGYMSLIRGMTSWQDFSGYPDPNKLKYQKRGLPVNLGRSLPDN